LKNEQIDWGFIYVAHPFWICLEWSQTKNKFCWKGVQNCTFKFSNWDSSTIWNASNITTNNQYGGFRKPSGKWGILSKSEKIKHVLCQAIIDIYVDQEIKLRVLENNEIELISDKLSAHRMLDNTYRSLSNFSELLSPQRPWINELLELLPVNVNCYLDGRYLETFTKLPARIARNFTSPDFPSPDFNVHCEGWTGWNPRRFVRTETIRKCSGSPIVGAYLESLNKVFFSDQSTKYTTTLLDSSNLYYFITGRNCTDV